MKNNKLSQIVLTPFLWFLGKHPGRHQPVPDIVRSIMVLVSSFSSIVAIDVTLKYGLAFKVRHSPSSPPWVGSIYS